MRGNLPNIHRGESKYLHNTTAKRISCLHLAVISPPGLLFNENCFANKPGSSERQFWQKFDTTVITNDECNFLQRKWVFSGDLRPFDVSKSRQQVITLQKWKFNHVFFSRIYKYTVWMEQNCSKILSRSETDIFKSLYNFYGSKLLNSSYFYAHYFSLKVKIAQKNNREFQIVFLSCCTIHGRMNTFCTNFF